jgi:uncharacterized protein (TIGR02145 family)
MTAIPIPLPKAYRRLFTGAIDADSIFATYAELETYATTNPIATEGQSCVVTEDGIATLYLINEDKSLTELVSVDSIVPFLETKADLVDGKVPASQLPAYVEAIEEYANLAAFPVTGVTGTIYIALDTNLIYRWGGTVYVPITSSLALGETSSTAYRGDRGKTAYDHSQVTHNKALVGLANVDNTSDANKPVSTATQTALDDKADKQFVETLASDLKNVYGVTNGFIYNQLAATYGLADDTMHPIYTSQYASLECGSGYLNGDTVTLVGGNSNMVCTVSVATTSISVSITSEGTGYVAGLYEVTGGTGLGMKIYLYKDKNELNADVYYVDIPVARVKELAPLGWRIPTVYDVDELIAFVEEDIQSLHVTTMLGVELDGTDLYGFSNPIAGIMDVETIHTTFYNSFASIATQRGFKYNLDEAAWIGAMQYWMDVANNSIFGYIEPLANYSVPVRCIMENPNDWVEGLRVTYNNVNYNTVKIGEQVWLKEPLITTKFNDGTPLIHVTEANDVSTQTDACYLYAKEGNIEASYVSSYNENYLMNPEYIQDTDERLLLSRANRSMIPKYRSFGYLYNHYVIEDIKGLAPTGWHVPTKAELETLLAYAIAQGGIHTIMADIAYPDEFGWYTPLVEGTNKTGMSLLPAGYKDSPYFGYKNQVTYLWSDTLDSGSNYFTLYISHPTAEINPLAKSALASIRFIKDDTDNTAGKVLIDGRWYKTITVGTQVWMAENLQTTKFADESDIPRYEGTGNSTTNWYCPYNFNEYYAGGELLTATKENIENNLIGEIDTHTHPTTYHEFSMDAFEVEWNADWIKLDLANYDFNTINYDISKSYVKDISLVVELGTGHVVLQGKARRPTISPSGSPESDPTYEFVGYYFKDTGNFLTPETDFSRIVIRTLIVVDTTTGGYWGDSDFPTVKWNRVNVVFNENNIDYDPIYHLDHRTRLTTTFNWMYDICSGDVFPNDILITAEDLLLPNPNYDGKLDGEMISYYGRFVDADLFMTALSQQAAFMAVSSNPDIFNIVAHFDNAYRDDLGVIISVPEYDYVYKPITDIDSLSTSHNFPRNTIMVGSGLLNDADSAWVTSYGDGMEFIEATRQIDMPGCTVWANYHQQSPAVAIVGAKMKYIKETTGVSWNTVRLACRATATQSTYNDLNNIIWDKYRGFGVIHVTNAITWINDLKESFKAGLTDRYEEGSGYASFMEYADFTENTPLPKRLVEAKLLEKVDVTTYNADHIHAGVFAYLSTRADTTITTAGTFQYIVGTFTNVISDSFTASGTPTPHIKYTGTETQYFEIDWHCSLSCSASNKTIQVSIFKNESIVAGSAMPNFCKVDDEVYNFSGTCVVSLATNDEIRLMVTGETSENVITFEAFTTTINRFHR